MISSRGDQWESVSIETIKKKPRKGKEPVINGLEPWKEIRKTNAQVLSDEDALLKFQQDPGLIWLTQQCKLPENI